MIRDFAELLSVAGQQPDAQRLLLMFARAEAEDHDSESQRGTLEPVMCVDKLPADVTGFKALINEADSINRDWDMVFVAGLSGLGSVPPSEKDAEAYLNKMVSDLRTGQSLTQYLVFDRQENLIRFEPH